MQAIKIVLPKGQRNKETGLLSTKGCRVIDAITGENVVCFSADIHISVDDVLTATIKVPVAGLIYEEDLSELT